MKAHEVDKALRQKFVADGERHWQKVTMDMLRLM